MYGILWCIPWWEKNRSIEQMHRLIKLENLVVSFLVYFTMNYIIGLLTFAHNAPNTTLRLVAKHQGIVN